MNSNKVPFRCLSVSFWLCDTVCLFTFHFTVMLIANPFPSVFVSRRTLESLQCSPGRSETGLRHAWSSLKSAHTALAVKACLLGGNSNTKCSMTFVNTAVAISALAGGGAKNGVAPRPEYGGFSTFFEDFWVSERKRVLKWNFGSFW